ncbi:MAG: BrnT family toxin [Selenomonadaceae bacterium]|nr:BrnT family toxin [Selenomonadaceae bacterium]MBR0102140.1 BrnT family toxin [Selenomonadaceae bacterium]MBR6712940.1 BrnT family toxin [Selenomonadaceae bacterium]
MLFEWDEEKNRINKRKHKISFETAANVFFDENRIEQLDEFHSDEEERWQVIGMVDEILFVIYTERDDKTRIISARRADKKERRMYYGNGNVYFA